MDRLKDIRKKFPEYDDLSDSDFVKGFYNRFYSDIPKDKFYAAIGFQEASTADEKSKTATAEKEEPAKPDYMGRRVSAALSAIQQQPTMPLASAAMAPYLKSIGVGAGEAAQNLLNFALKRAGKEPVKIFDSEQAYDPEVAKFAKEVAPMTIPFAGEEAALAKVGKLIPYGKTLAGGIAKGAARLAAKSAIRGTYGAGLGAISELATDKDATPESAKHAMLLGSAINSAFGGLLDVIPGAYKGLSNYYKNQSEKLAGRQDAPLSPEQATVLHNALKQDILSFPDLVKSPKLQSFYHGFLKYIPFSGVNKQAEKAITNLERDSAKIHSNSTGNVNEADPISARQDIIQAIKDHVENETKNWESKYSDIRSVPIKIIPKNKIKFIEDVLEKNEKGKQGTGSIFSTETENSLRKKLQESKQTKSSTLLQYPESIRKQIEEKTMEAIPETTIGDSNIGISKILEDANNLESSGASKDAFILKQLANAARTDQKEAASKLPQHLYNKFLESNSEYAKKIVPFKHPEKRGLWNLLNDKLSTNKPELEKILQDDTNKEALEQLAQPTKTKIFSRILNSNIGKTEEAFGTRAEKMASAYDKMSSYEKKFLDEQGNKEFENLSKRVKQLQPVLTKSKNKILQSLYKIRHIGYALGAYGAYHHPAYALPAIIPLSMAAKFLRSPKLMETYKKGKYTTGKLEEVARQLSKPLLRAAITKLED